MARGINKVILIGNLGDEPTLRTTSNGTSVVNISMVTNEIRRNIENSQSTELAEWHRVVMWGKLAEIANQYLHKGSQIYIEGKLRTRTYSDKQNQKHSVTEIVADEMQMLGNKNTTYAQEQIMNNPQIDACNLQTAHNPPPAFLTDDECKFSTTTVDSDDDEGIPF
ncbi:MAG: single-stranded DNA-binding protein [Succinivibrio sp.]